MQYAIAALLLGILALQAFGRPFRIEFTKHLHVHQDYPPIPPEAPTPPETEEERIRREQYKTAVDLMSAFNDAYHGPRKDGDSE